MVVYYYLYAFPLLMRILIAFLAAVYVLVGIVWLPLYFSRTCYIVSSQEVIRSAGFFLRVRQLMKISAIQYATLVTTPFSRVTGLNFVVVNALGGNLLLLFLSRQDAEEILRTLTSSIRSRTE